MEDLLERRLLVPLGMKSTALVRSERSVVPDIASPYMEDAAGNVTRGGWGLEVNCEGGIVSTLGDLALWMSELRSPRVLTKETLSGIVCPHVLNNGSESRYGLGLFTRTIAGRRSFGHGGRMPGFRAEVVRFPDEDIAIIVLTNRHSLDPHQVVWRASQAWCNAADDPVPAGPLPAGRFLAPESGDFMELVSHADGIRLAGSSGQLPLEHLGADR